MVFTPDASFPLINIEKGMIRADILGDYQPGSVVSFSGGSIPNAVPDKAEAVLRGIPYEEVRAVIAANSTGAVLTVDTEPNGDITLPLLRQVGACLHSADRRECGYCAYCNAEQASAPGGSAA